MSLIFLDASALAKAYLDEEGTTNDQGVIHRQGGLLFLSEFVALEVLTSIRSAYRDAPRNVYQRALDRFWKDYPTRFILAEVREPVVKLAIEMTTDYRRARARSMDVLHVATALKIQADGLADEVTMVTSDRDLAALSKEVGLRTFDPSREPLAALRVRQQ